MQSATVARNYAEALLELAVREGDVELYGRQFDDFVRTFEAETDFRRFLETPRIEAAAKKRVLREVFEGVVAERLLRFLLIVIDKGRQRLLPQIADEFAELVNEHFGRLRVQVTVAQVPDAELEVKMKDHLERLFDREVLPSYRIDPNLVGGVVIRVGDRIMDGSVKHRLHVLRRMLLATQVA